MNKIRERNDVSTLILQDILQNGHFDYQKIIGKLMEITSSVIAQCFELAFLGQETYVCKYSTTSEYVVGNKYILDKIPLDQYPIYHRTNVIAVICLDNVDAIEEFPKDIRQKLHDSICIGLVVGNLQDAKYNFVMNICNTLHIQIQEIMELMENFPIQSSESQDKIAIINEKLSLTLATILNTMDQIEIDAEKVKLKTKDIYIRTFLQRCVQILHNEMTIDLEIDEQVPKIIIADERLLEQMIITILKSISDLKNIHLHTSSTDILLIFRIFSHTDKQNKELIKRFKNDTPSLDIYVVQRLCEIMKGIFDVNETNGLTMKVKIDLPW